MHVSKITKIIQRKVHFLYTKNLPIKLPGYGLVWSMAGALQHSNFHFHFTQFHKVGL